MKVVTDLEHLFDCAVYILVIGLLSHVVGEALPRGGIDYTRVPFKPFSWEKSGAVYNALHVRQWKDHVPDMSRVSKKMVSKKLSAVTRLEEMERLIKETCVAEIIHVSLTVLSLMCIVIWPGAGGVIVSILCVLGNGVFIIIQRYNRPKLVKVYERLRRGEHLRMEPEKIDTECEHKV